MKLIFIHGPPASGKYTIAQLLSEATSIPLFHNHLVVDVAKSLFEFGETGFKRIREQMWRFCFEEAASANKSMIFTFNPERTVSPDLIRDMLDIYRSRGAAVFIIELLCSDTEIVKRIGNESRKKFAKLTDPEVYEQFKREGGFDFPSLPKPDVTIDSEENTPEESVELILNII